MNIEFICEHCGKALTVQDYLAGQRVECYHCHQPVVIPQEGEKAIIEFQCLGCGTKFRVPASRAGSRSRCPTCQAALVVPGASTATAATPPPAPAGEVLPLETFEPAYEEEYVPPPARPSMQTRRTSSTSPRPTAAHGAPTPEEEGYVLAPKKGVSAGWVIFWVALGIFALGAVVMVLSRGRGDDDGGKYAKISALVRYNDPLDVFEVTNTSGLVWSSVTITIETPAGEYVHRMASLGPDQPVTVEGKQFVSKTGAAFDSGKVRGERVVIRATLPSGTAGRFILKWGGRAK